MVADRAATLPKSGPPSSEAQPDQGRNCVRNVTRASESLRSLVERPEILLLVLVLGACGPSESTSSCDPISLSPTVSDAARVVAEAGFDPTWPCSTRGGFTVTGLRIDSLGAEAANRLVVVVTVGGERAYTLTASPGRVPFTAIPRGAEPITVESAEARGFRGRSAAGTDIAFLQWQHRGLTYEVTATLGPRFDLDSLRSVVVGMTAVRAVSASAVVD